MTNLKVQYVTNGAATSGVGHQAEEIAKRLASLVSLSRWHLDGEAGKLWHDGQEVARIRSWPWVLGSKSVNWVRLGNFINPPPPSLIKEGATSVSPDKGRSGGVFHFTNQTLSFLGKDLHPSVVTVHDIIELVEPQDLRARFINRYLYSGIREADLIISVSEYTKMMLIEHLQVPAEKISVIHNGVGPEFHPITDFRQTLAYQELRHQLKLAEGTNVVLYVGSDHPRKNVIAAVQAFAHLRGPKVFVKVGAAGLPAGRAALLAEIDRLGIRDSVRFINTVDVEKLNILYNLADVFVYPSLFEGFGLPPLQAMAAGTPVVTSNVTSLPEVVETAAVMCDPSDVEAMAAAVQKILDDEGFARELRTKGLARAQQFTWDRAAAAVVSVYTKLQV